MANVLTQTRYLPPCRPTATATATTTTAAAATAAAVTAATTSILEELIDQVDNSTNSNQQQQIFKACIVNRMNDKYHREDERLRTYEGWNVSFMDKKELAMTGMFYTNQEDKVKCYFCEVEIGRWERGDHPVAEHLRWSTNCPLLRRRTTNNVPLNPDALERLLPPISYDICGSNDTSALEVREHAYSEGRSMNLQAAGLGFSAGLPLITAAQTVPNMPTTNVNCNGNQLTRNYCPEYPEYAIETARLRSFADWPRHMKQKPQQLAEAGFFYTGVGDRVRCYSCGGGLKDWAEHDEPWEQHALWLNHCRFLKLIKGQLYIDGVAAAQAAQEQQQRAEQEQRQEEQQTEAAKSSTAATEQQQQSSDVASSSSSNATAAQLPVDVPPVPKVATATAAATAATAAAVIPEEKLCKICYGAEYNTAFLPCGHVVACAQCASSVTKCPLCRKPFTDVMRVYFS